MSFTKGGVDLSFNAGDGKKNHRKQISTSIQRMKVGNPGTLIFQPSALSITGHNFQCMYMGLGWEPAIQLHHVTFLILGVWKAQRFAALGFPGITATLTAITSLLLWCPHARAWWALQRFLVCQTSRSWFTLEGTEKESCDISAETTLHSRHPS